MPRGPRIDAPGLLHHVRARGVEKRKVFLTDEDREDFLLRLSRVGEEHGAIVYAWCLMGNHFHLSIRTGRKPLAKTMTGILTGYAMGFNKRHGRAGHLFQNRYQSTVVEEERYFLALVRYIHRNPVRARIVQSFEELNSYPWTGHAVLMGQRKYHFQDTDTVLEYFGKRAGPARRSLVEFMSSAEAKTQEQRLKGGGLLRSIGGLGKLREYRAEKKWAYDDRILGDGAIVESVLSEVETYQSHQLDDLSKRQACFEAILVRLCQQYEITRAELLGGSKRRVVSEVRQLLSYAGIRQLGIPAADIGRALNVSGQSVLQGATRAEAVWESLDWIMEER